MKYFIHVCTRYPFFHDCGVSMTGLDALSLALGSKNDKHFDAVRDGIADLKQEVTGLQEALRTNELIICDIDSGSTR